MPTEAILQSPIEVGEVPSESPFYIPATSSESRPRRSLKYGDSFMVLDSHGDIGATEGGSDGLFYCDTRFLSRLELQIDGMPPLLLGSNVRDDNSVYSVDLTNPDIMQDGQNVLQKDTLHIVRTTFLWRTIAYQRIGLRNHGDYPIRCDLSVRFHGDFADLFEVRGLTRPRRGIVQQKLAGPQEVLLRYKGLDWKIRRTSIVLDPAPTRLEQGIATYRLELAPQQRMSIFVVVECDRPEDTRPRPFFAAMLAARRELRSATRRATTVQTSNDIFNEVLCRSMADLYMLITDTPEGPYPYAGIPWYSTTFGRDGMITALQTLWFDPDIARGVLRRLARYQARVDDDVADAQPGKILHEMRGGEMATLNEVPFGLYYGSVDSTPLFVLLAGLYVERTGDVETLAALWPAVEQALAWIDGPGDVDRDGFVEYKRANEKGLVNQGWKDSFDAIFHADGRLADGPVALAEVQGYVYAAKRAAARCARRLGHDARAGELDAAASVLAERFEEAFWCPEIGTYALALDGSKQPCRVRTSHAGQLLFTGIVRPDRAAEVATGLMSPRFSSGWGIRTVASTEARFNPMSYHNGSVWPHDNALIALGFARYGLSQAVDSVFRGLFEAASYMDLRRLPELYCGFQRRRRQGPTLYPVACAPQAWASGAPFLLLQASLGLEFDPVKNEIRLSNPSLPSFLGEVKLSGLRLGGSSVDLTVLRHGGHVALQVERNFGNVQVSVVSK
ncbi:MAG: amylo-alpha-1,6-glucosidase [Xanthobacteraceae bacterium]